MTSDTAEMMAPNEPRALNDQKIRFESKSALQINELTVRAAGNGGKT